MPSSTWPDGTTGPKILVRLPNGRDEFREIPAGIRAAFESSPSNYEIVPVLPQQVAEDLAEKAKALIEALEAPGVEVRGKLGDVVPITEANYDLSSALNTYHAAIGRNDES